MTQSIDLNTWYREAVDAAEHLDAFPAYHLLRTFDKNVAQFESDYAGNGQMKTAVEALKRKLRFVAFPELPLVEAAKVLSTEAVSFLKSGIDLDDRFSVRSDFTPYGEHENERKVLKQAFLKNQEKIGRLGIGEWLLAFDKAYAPLTRNENAILEFLTHNSSVPNLPKSEYEMLRIILFVYERWLATGRLSIYDVAFLNKEGGKYEVGMKVEPVITKSFPQRTLSAPPQRSGIAPVQLPLLQALSKYDQLGNQLITSERIKVKSQTEPVRPSLLYWIKYYRDELGVGHHDSVQRGQFLFRSENGKKLSPEERERVNLILKSVEENMPLPIDTEKNEIVFPHFEAPLERPILTNIPPLAFEPKRPVALPQTQQLRPERTFQVGRGIHFDEGKESVTTEKGTLSFSSPHVFPAEKEKVIARTPAEKSNPFHIRPVSMMTQENEEK